MSGASQKAWFSPKRYGYGATPATWQGWVATFVFVIAFVLDMSVVRGWVRWVGAVVLVAAFVAIACLKTGGEWRWRWGKH